MISRPGIPQPSPGRLKTPGLGIQARRFLLHRLFTGAPGWPPVIVWAPALVVAAALLLSPAYLLIRTAGAGSEAWDLLFRMRVLEILGRTLLLVASVTTVCVALAVPLAWLTVRTDLPARTAWAAWPLARKPSSNP